MLSAYLDSDSETELTQVSDSSSDGGLPICDIIRSPPKIAKLDDSRGHAHLHSSLLTPSSPVLPKLPPTAPRTPDTMRLLVHSSAQSPSPRHFLPRPFTSANPSPRHLLLPPTSASPSPCKLVERHQKSLHQQTKLTRKVEKLTADLKSRTEKMNKLKQLRSRGGICGVSRDFEEQKKPSTSSDGDDGDRTAEQDVSRKPRASYIESYEFPFPLFAPGYPVLVSPPNLITELYPPGYHDDGPPGRRDDWPRSVDHEVLSQLIRDRWFLMPYREKPCPRAIWQWLFQIMCLACERQLSDMVYCSLKSLVGWSTDQGSVYVPSLHTVWDVLVNLGADKHQLEGGGSLQQGGPPTPSEDEVFLTAASAEVRANLANLFGYISCAVRANPLALGCADLRHLLCTLARVSLDCCLSKCPHVLCILSECLASLLGAVPEPSLPATLTFLTAHLVKLSSHHHNLLHLTRLLRPATPRMARLQGALCKVCLWKLVFPGKGGKFQHLSDWQFAWAIVKHYCDMPAAKFVYYNMYSVVCLLSLLLNLEPLEWPSGEEKRAFKAMLTSLGSVKIKDIAESAERAPVKDLFMSMAMEMANQRTRDSKQTDLFSSLGN